MVRTFVVASLLSLFGCNGEEGKPALFPEDYAETYQEVRDCRNSNEHDLFRIRIVVAPDIVPNYVDRTAPFPPGSIIVKEEYDDGDDNCEGDVKRYSAAIKLDIGSSPETLDWKWQRVNADMREVEETETNRCIGCHMECGHEPMGFDGTCAEP